MTENVAAWWARRQRSTGREVPYERGQFSTQWSQYPVLVRQFHPDLNHGVALSQVPLGAEVYLLWECESGHRFVATPSEHRARDGHARRKSTWCPECKTAGRRARKPLTWRDDAGMPAQADVSAVSAESPVSPVSAVAPVLSRDALAMNAGDAGEAARGEQLRNATHPAPQPPDAPHLDPQPPDASHPAPQLPDASHPDPRLPGALHPNPRHSRAPHPDSRRPDAPRTDAERPDPHRPGGEWAERRRAAQARPRIDEKTYQCGHPLNAVAFEGHDESRCSLCRRLHDSRITRASLLARVAPAKARELERENSPLRRYSWRCELGHPAYFARIETILGGGGCPVCESARTLQRDLSPGDAFRSPAAPRPASAAEANLRERLGRRLEVDLTPNAVRVARPFFSHLEVWPDIPIAELRVAIEYDTTGRSGLEHVGQREVTDRRKDRLLREVDWEVIRVRSGKLEPIGPYDVHAAGISGALIERVMDQLREIRGSLIVDAYSR